MTEKELSRLIAEMNKFIKSRDSKEKDSWYDTDQGFAKGILADFRHWSIKNNDLKAGKVKRISGR